MIAVPGWVWAILAWTLSVAVAFVGGCQHERSAFKNAETIALAKRDTTDRPVIAQEALDYVQTTARPLIDAPHVFVCPTPREVHAAAAARPVLDAVAAVPAEAPRDIGAPVETVGRDADAQVTALQSYIRDVCLR